MNKALLFFSFQLLVKAANSEWVLGIHVQHFQNQYNAVYRDTGNYCCCDTSYEEVPCEASIALLNVAECANECEPYYVIRFEVCFANGTCSNMKNETAAIDNLLATCISPLLVQLPSNESMNGNITMNDNIVNTTIYVDVRDSGADSGDDDYLIDQFTIVIPGTVSNCVDESNSLTVQGQHGIGNLTVTYFNLTTDPITSCSSADVSTFSTSSPIPTTGISMIHKSPTLNITTTSTATSPVLKSLPETITHTSYVAATVTISSCPAAMATSNLCPEATQVVEEATGQTAEVWRIAAIAALAVAALLAIACIALCIITCRRKKGLPSQETAVTSKDKELEPIMTANDDDNKGPVYDPVAVSSDEAQEEDLSHHVYSSVDMDKKSSDRQSGKSDPTEDNS